MKKILGFALIGIALVWGFFVLILYGDSFMTESKVELYSAIIFAMIAVGLYPIIVKSKK